MKALTLTQPWASLVIEGVKRYETRGWQTAYRGPLAIHAAKGWTSEDRDFLSDLIRSGVLRNRPTARTPLGAVLGIVELEDVFSTDSGPYWDWDAGIGLTGYTEADLGDYSPRRFAWRLRVVEPFPEPIPAKGALGLWDWRPDQLTADLAALAASEGPAERVVVSEWTRGVAS